MSIAISGSSITFPDQTQMSTASGDSFRNRIINGDMRIDQRNAGASVTLSSSGVDKVYTVDRWAAFYSAISKYTVQRQPVTNPEQADNNTFCLVATSSSAYTVQTSDYFFLGQFIEGFNSADLGWGTSGAKTITISFWVYSTLIGTFGGAVRNSATTRSYPFTYSISSVNTWEKKIVIIAGDTSGTWLTDNGVGLRIHFGLGVGSTYSGTAGSWAGANYFSATGSVSLVGTNGAGLAITGVQLEQGSTATEFERRPIGTELALCQRYFWKSFDQSVKPAQNTANSNGGICAMGFANGVQFNSYVQLPVTMRSSPTVVTFSPDNASANWSIDGLGIRPIAVAQNIGTNSFHVAGTPPVSQGGYYVIHATATSEL